MSVIRLRTMTKKSPIQGGKNEGFLVGDIMKKCKLDLIYMYYHYDLLSFCDEILDELHIKAEDRIAKPGKAPELYEYYRNRNIKAAEMTRAKLMVRKDDPKAGLKIATCINSKKKRVMRAKLIEQRKQSAFQSSKSYLQAMNHGHLKY